MAGILVPLMEQRQLDFSYLAGSGTEILTLSLRASRRTIQDWVADGSRAHERYPVRRVVSDPALPDPSVSNRWASVHEHGVGGR